MGTTWAGKHKRHKHVRRRLREGRRLAGRGAVAQSHTRSKAEGVGAKAIKANAQHVQPLFSHAVSHMLDFISFPLPHTRTTCPSLTLPSESAPLRVYSSV
jgi:hypothetical protein